MRKCMCKLKKKNQQNDVIINCTRLELSWKYIPSQIIHSPLLASHLGPSEN